jgi:hypothetical protein
MPRRSTGILDSGLKPRNLVKAAICLR